MIISERIFYMMEKKNMTQLELSKGPGLQQVTLVTGRRKRQIPKRTACYLYVMHWRLLPNSF